MTTISSVRTYCLSLPQTTEAPHFNYSSFRVAGKIFVTVPPEETHIHVFVGEQERETALAVAPEALEKLFWGQRVLGLRVNLALLREPMLRQLLRQAWRHKAPKKLATTALPD